MQEIAPDRDGAYLDGFKSGWREAFDFLLKQTPERLEMLRKRQAGGKGEMRSG
jgi:hypothetical protein